MWRYFDGNPPNGGVGKKRDSGRISGFAAYRSTVLSTVRVVKCEKQNRDERRQASSPHRGVRRPFAQGQRNVSDGLDVIRRRQRRSNPQS